MYCLRVDRLGDARMNHDVVRRLADVESWTTTSARCCCEQVSARRYASFVSVTGTRTLHKSPAPRHRRRGRAITHPSNIFNEILIKLFRESCCRNNDTICRLEPRVAVGGAEEKHAAAVTWSQKGAEIFHKLTSKVY